MTLCIRRMALMGLPILLWACNAGPPAGSTAENATAVLENLAENLEAAADNAAGDVDNRARASASPNAAVPRWAATRREASDSPVFCDLVGDILPPAECARLRTIRERLPQGTAAIAGPGVMRRGETAIFSFALARSADASAASGLLGRTADETATLRVGRRMAAELKGLGFDIEPQGLVAKDLYAGDGARWDWKVTARSGDAHVLMLDAFIVLTSEEGVAKPQLLRAFSRTVQVKVGTMDRIKDGADAAGQWLQTGTNLVKLLSGLVVALSGLWLAIRLFGKSQRPAG